jgi:ribonucleoside-diphosphate reductase subunit M1
MFKRNDTKEIFSTEKLTSRLVKLCFNLNMEVIDLKLIVEKIKKNCYSGITSITLDNLAAEIIAKMADLHPDYGKLAVRIAVTNLHKQTKKKFSDVINNLYNNNQTIHGQEMISKKVLDFVNNNADKFNSSIIYNSDHNYSYCKFKEIKNQLSTINGEIVERIEHMIMRRSIAFMDYIDCTDVDRCIQLFSKILENKSYLAF